MHPTSLRWATVGFVLLGLVSLLVLAVSAAADAPTWEYPRHDLQNSAASEPYGWRVVGQPAELWQLPAAEDFWFHLLFQVAGDIDGDGRPEFVIGASNHRDRVYQLLALNVEDGSRLWTYDVGDWFLWSMPILVDLDGDEKLDVVLASNSRVLALAGDDAQLLWEQPFPSSGMGMTVADVDGDGRPEVILNDYGSQKRIHLLDGQDGSEIWSVETGGSAYNIPTVHDLDGDGKMEILSHSHLYSPSREQLLVWDGDGHVVWTYVAEPSPEQQARAPAELGFVPDYGYISTSVADFDGDGHLEVGWGTRCHYYVLSATGALLWRVPTVQGYGVSAMYRSDGAILADDHGVGGPSGYAAAVGRADDDLALEVVLSFSPEYRELYYEITSTYLITDVTPSNVVRAFDGRDGSLEWAFEGSYPSSRGLESMREPLLVDLDADGLLDVLVLSSDGHLYALEGDSGEKLMEYPIPTPPYGWAWVNPGPGLTFVGDGDRGVVLFVSDDNVLHALQVATRWSTTYLPLILRG